jgi:DNA topoisomerase-1
MQSQTPWERKSAWFRVFWIVMFSMGQRRLAAAFLTRSSRVGIQRLNLPGSIARERLLRPLQLAKAKSTFVRQASLVVHGPPDFSVNKKSERPFKLVIVESPSKCKTISNILQEYVNAEGLDHDYVVTSCMGHIRNIPQKKTIKGQKVAGIDLEGGKYEPTYTILPEKEQLVEDLQKLASQSQQLVLATDDDREGEAMAWHLVKVLSEEQSTESSGSSSNDQLPPLRVRFTEITPKAITESIFQHASTSLRENLVQAQETRRILDRLAGFTVSPILWKKIAPGLSAGRVQSVGMAMIVQRERERLLFHETEYWDIQANFTAKTDTFPSTLVSVNGSPLASGGSDFEPRLSNELAENSKHKIHLKEKKSRDLVQRFETEDWKWTIANITEAQRKLNPPAPFITSTLQQESNNRLGLSVSQTMQTAQQLYENGFISYMRTDSNHLSDDAKEAIKTEIVQDYGGLESFQPVATQRSSKKKTKNKPEAQAAHEAIRPAIQPDGRFAKPGTLPPTFDGAAIELYTLIYQRTVASHMPPQVSKQTTIRILGESDIDDTEVLFRTTGSVIVKPGYTAVYPKQSKSSSPTLPQLEEDQKLDCDDSLPIQHITQPPSRFTEASFVQELEALGVGRPSTYAGTVKILRDRAYVGSPHTTSRKPKTVSGPAISAQRAAGGEDFTGSARGPMVPSLSAFVVCSLLEKYCSMYVDPSFTAKMEERLDLIANSEETVGDDQRIAYLDEFYAGEDGLAAQIQKIDELVVGDDARRADLPALKYDSSEAENNEEIGLFVGPWGPYVKRVLPHDADGAEKPVSAQLPAGMASDLSTISMENLKGLIVMKEQKGSILGQHPEDGRNIRLKIGRFGAFLQWGEDDEEGTSTHTLPAHMRTMKDIGTIDESSPNGLLGLSLEEAVVYVNLPRTVCTMDDQPIIAAIGPYGPYLKYNNTFVTLRPADGDVVTIDPETAKQVVTEGLEKKSSKLATRA